MVVVDEVASKLVVGGGPMVVAGGDVLVFILFILGNWNKRK